VEEYVSWMSTRRNKINRWTRRKRRGKVCFGAYRRIRMEVYAADIFICECSNYKLRLNFRVGQFSVSGGTFPAIGGMFSESDGIFPESDGICPESGRMFPGSVF
jgi:hypothetical protein